MWFSLSNCLEDYCSPFGGLSLASAKFREEGENGGRGSEQTNFQPAPVAHFTVVATF